MVFVFLDESLSAYRDYESYKSQYLEKAGDSPKNAHRPYPYFILGAVALDECLLPVVDGWFDGVKRRFLGSPGFATGPEHEIKGSTLYARLIGRPIHEWGPEPRGRKSIQRQAQQRVWEQLTGNQLKELEQSIFDLFRRVSPTIWVVVVDQPMIFKKYCEKTWPPLFLALTYLQQRVVHHVQARYGAYQQALFLMDETSNLSTAAHFEAFLSTREAINGSAAWPVDFRRWLIDIPVAGKSHLHQALQLADIVAHATERHFSRRDTLGWFSRIEPFLARHWTTNEPRNAGLTCIR